MGVAHLVVGRIAVAEVLEVRLRKCLCANDKSIHWPQPDLATTPASAGPAACIGDCLVDRHTALHARPSADVVSESVSDHAHRRAV